MPLVRAINSCLRGVGLAPIAAIEEADSNLDAAFALQNIEQASRDIQSKGWWFNQEANWKLTPDTQGRIKVPNNIIAATVFNGSRSEPIIRRGDYFYDRYTHGLDLSSYVQSDGKIEFQFITFLDFLDLPDAAQNAIQYRARRLYAHETVGDPQMWKFNSKDEQDAFIILDADQRRNRKDNYFQNPTASNLLGLIAGPNGTASRPTGFQRQGIT